MLNARGFLGKKSNSSEFDTDKRNIGNYLIRSYCGGVSCIISPQNALLFMNQQHHDNSRFTDERVWLDTSLTKGADNKHSFIAYFCSTACPMNTQWTVRSMKIMRVFSKVKFWRFVLIHTCYLLHSHVQTLLFIMWSALSSALCLYGAINTVSASIAECFSTRPVHKEQDMLYFSCNDLYRRVKRHIFWVSWKHLL